MAARNKKQTAADFFARSPVFTHGRHVQAEARRATALAALYKALAGDF